MANNGQTINDRILAAKHSLAGQGLAKAVCKATTEELIGPKKKHLDYLLHCTEEPNVSIPSLANLLIERTQGANWIVVFKGLVTIHHLMCYGNERFVQYLASSNTNFQLSSFVEKGGVQERIQTALAQATSLDPNVKHYIDQIRALGGTVRGYDMTPFIRRYAKYLHEKAVSYRSAAFDFCKVKRGKDGGTLRSMTLEKLFKTISPLQNQIDALVDFEVTTNDLNNGVINSAFMLLFRDLIRLFACYNDGIINLLEKYFDMNKKNAREALDIYKKFLIRMDRVADFLKVAEKFGIDKNDIPDLARIVGIDTGELPDFAKAPSSLLDALESHLANLEGRKPGSTATTPTGAGSSTLGANQIDDKLQQQILAEEEQALAKYKEQQRATNPFAVQSEEPASVATTDNGTPNILDLFGCTAPQITSTTTTTSATPNTTKTSDDLLQLSGGNPFASVLNTTTPHQPTFNNSPFGGGGSVNANGFSNHSPFTPPVAPLIPGGTNNSFASESSFQNAFGTNSFSYSVQHSTKDVGASFFGDILQPQGTTMTPNTGSKKTDNSNAKVITGDLDASLANLTSNLNLGAGQPKKFASIHH